MVFSHGPEILFPLVSSVDKGPVIDERSLIMQKAVTGPREDGLDKISGLTKWGLRIVTPSWTNSNDVNKPARFEWEICFFPPHKSYSHICYGQRCLSHQFHTYHPKGPPPPHPSRQDWSPKTSPPPAQRAPSLLAQENGQRTLQPRRRRHADPDTLRAQPRRRRQAHQGWQGAPHRRHDRRRSLDCRRKFVFTPPPPTHTEAI